MTIIYSGPVGLLRESKSAFESIVEQTDQRDWEILCGVIDVADSEGDGPEVMIVDLLTMKSRIYPLADGWERKFSDDIASGAFREP